MFGEIAHQVVGQCGISGAWKLRGVCRTFNATITHDIFAKQPLRSFTNLKKSPLEKDLGLYLFYRSKSLLNAKSQLLDKTNEMIQYLATELGKTKKDEMKDLRQRLCDKLGKIIRVSDVFVALKDGLESDVSIQLMDKLIVVTCLNLQGLLVRLMGQLSSYQGRSVFGGPLEAAASLGHVALLKIILGCLEGDLKGNYRQIRQLLCWCSAHELGHNGHGFRFHTAILVAIAQGNCDIVTLLSNWYHSRIGRFPKFVHNAFLNRALRTPGLKPVRSVLTMSCGYFKSQVTQLHYEVACSQQRADIVRLFFKEGYIKVNDETLTTSPLLKAVHSNSVKIVKVVLAAGANPNATYFFRSEKLSPMSLAIRKKNSEMIQCLLNAGAALPKISEWPHHQKAYEVLRKAHMKNSTGWVPAFKDFKTFKDFMTFQASKKKITTHLELRAKYQLQYGLGYWA